MRARWYRSASREFPAFEMRIGFVVSREDLAHAVAARVVNYGEEAPRSRREALDLMRRQLRQYGEFTVDLDDPEEGEPDPLEAALELVDRLFPELRPAPPR